MVKISTAEQLGAVSLILMFLVALWFAVTGYTNALLPWVVGILALAFLAYGCFLWLKWRKEQGMVSWRAKYRKRRPDLPPHPTVLIDGANFRRNKGAGAVVHEHGAGTLEVRGANFEDNEGGDVVMQGPKK